MKYLILSLFLLLGCTQVVRQNCTIYDEYNANPGNSIIAAKIHNPCDAVRLITIAAKLPAVRYGDYAEKFDKWALKVSTMIKGGISYKNLQELILIEVSRLNTEIGMAFLIISPELLNFYEVGFLKEKDVELMLALIDHLRYQVSLMKEV